MCDVIDERDELEMMEREMPVPFRMEPDMDSFVGIMKTFCPARFISGDVVYHYTKSNVFEELMKEDGDKRFWRNEQAFQTRKTRHCNIY